MTCDKPAVALLAFSPPDAKAWLYDLDEPDPTGGIVLCRKHANATVVPMSWQLVDVRDPAWPGPVGSQPPVQAMMAASAEEVMPLSACPSATSAIDEEFAALQERIPVSPQHYAESQLVTANASGSSIKSDLMVDLGNEKLPDPSLFELPISDIPAVTPYSR
ncbi:MAG: DUF3499 family protein [Acidimicrobiales bacterium]|jgi:hypothetical protein